MEMALVEDVGWVGGCGCGGCCYLGCPSSQCRTMVEE